MKYYKIKPITLSIFLVIVQIIFMCNPLYAGVIKTHTFSLVDTPKYLENFKYFDYVNPEALKGGTLRRGMKGSFDSFNSFAIKGIPARAIGSIYDTLMVASRDEPSTCYGLLAKSMEYPDDYSWVIFNLRDNARFNDGKPLTAEDVVFSFNAITKVSPHYKNYFKLIANVEVLDRYRVKFNFKKDGSNKEMPFIAGQLTVIPKHYWQDHDISKSSLKIPLGSGPYRIDSFDAGKKVILKRVEDYWGKDIPVNIGINNFGTIIYEYYKDNTVLFEAFKAGHYDLRGEGAGKRWYKGYKGKYFKNKMILKEEIPHKKPQGISGVVFNTAERPFNNLLVRKALNYAYDFEWLNKNLFFNQYKRHESYFSNSELASSGIPDHDELEFINNLKSKIPESVFKQFSLPITDGKGNNRDNLIQAVKLLNSAGYEFKDGVMIDSKGNPLHLEILIASKSLEKRLIPFKKNLQRVGIELSIHFVDSTQYVEKIRSHDFQMIYTRFRQSVSPGNEQRAMWHSTTAKERGSRNYASIENNAIDEVVDLVINAPDRKSLITRTKVLDRLLLSGYYLVPDGYSDSFRIAYWDKFGKPEKMPEYSLGFNTWWIIPEKEKRIDKVLNR